MINQALPRILVLAWIVSLAAGICFCSRATAFETNESRIDEAPLENTSWPQFRGPAGNGITNAKNIPASFGEQENLVWKTPVEGTGWSSPVLTEDKIWITAAVPQGKKTERRGSGGMEIGYESIDLYAKSYDRKTGAAKDSILLFSISNPEIIHSLNSYASPTPCVSKDEQGVTVYCHFGTYGTAAVDADAGTVRWRNEEIHLDHQTGPGSSPILCNDRLIFHADGIDTQSIVGLNTSDGTVAWRTTRSGKMANQRDMKKAFCTPIVADIDGKKRIVSTAADWMYVYDPANGKEELKVPYGKLGFSTVPRPVVEDQIAYFCTGFMKGRLLAVDLSTAKFETPADRILWSFEKRVPTMPSPLIMGDSLLMVSETGIATCLDRKTGDEIWVERLGGKFSSSPVMADGKIFIGNQDGEVFVLQPGNQFRLLKTNQLDSDIMASPAIVDGQIYFRTADSLYRFGKN